MRWRLLFPLIVVYSSLRSFTASGGVPWVHVPLLGVWRFDVAALLMLVILALSIPALVFAGGRQAFQIAAVMLCVLHIVQLRSVWPGFLQIYTGFNPHAHGVQNMRKCVAQSQAVPHAEMFQACRVKLGCTSANISIMSEAFPSNVTNALKAAAWRATDVWTHLDMAGPLPAFVLGPSYNHDEHDEGEGLKKFWWGWSFMSGFDLFQGQDTRDVLDDDASEHRAAAKAVFDEIRPWLSPLLRRSIGNALSVDPSEVLLGGEIGFELGNYPAIQVWLPNPVWSVVLNAHDDLMYRNAPAIQRLEGCDRSSLQSFLWSIQAPLGTGLLHWDVDGEEHETLYTPGAFQSFPASRFHSIRAWPAAEWSGARMTMQAFGIRCGKTWYAYH